MLAVLLVLACDASPTADDSGDTPRDTGDTSKPEDTADTGDSGDTGEDWTPAECSAWLGFSAPGVTWTWATAAGADSSVAELVAVSVGAAEVHEVGVDLDLRTWWRCTPEGSGIASYVMERAGVVTSVVYDPPCPSILVTPALGAEWQCEQTLHVVTDGVPTTYGTSVAKRIVSDAEVTTPAGTFPALEVEETLGYVTMRFWYAEDFGLLQKLGYVVTARTE